MYAGVGIKNLKSPSMLGAESVAEQRVICDCCEHNYRVCEKYCGVLTAVGADSSERICRCILPNGIEATAISP